MNKEECGCRDYMDVTISDNEDDILAKMEARPSETGQGTYVTQIITHPHKEEVNEDNYEIGASEPGIGSSDNRESPIAKEAKNEQMKLGNNQFEAAGASGTASKSGEQCPQPKHHDNEPEAGNYKHMTEV